MFIFFPSGEAWSEKSELRCRPLFRDIIIRNDSNETNQTR